ncbi:hypothetical protein PFICI_07460 [Pestalotiopsis fici W106-1]|uniref:Heterokaryon incompatibility domain-containing protein n=1 Tax=Pestalotiopsis fici (strain W106-1 / CGMCC3.15140) TaxID=1229662 RepID=W3X430_PESFW|nr:uncharacterized protein PFICI_07460 [Pestalotiopsis fici W106-1]ETS79931.1 hypothetical protein PFICI_07460 [Pestalotiopsis fici W106-1]
MRLLQLRDGELTLSNHPNEAVPEYAILSHTWGLDDEEVTFQDLMQKQGKDKIGYKKLMFCGQQAKRDGLDYFWVDTCCIDKANHTELSRAINSMFRWYHNAVHCYVFLSDVSTQPSGSSASWEPQFRRSKWYQRGWTLQELLAPTSVKFYSVEGDFLGDKSGMVDVIHDITKIKVTALRGASLAQFPIHERMNWSRRRQTKEEEDIAYCLFGIFDVFMPLIYGEGEQNAMSRLEEAIEKRTGSSRKPDPPVQSPASHLILPFGQNEDFVGREEILSQLVDRILPSARKTDCQRTVLEGLGGVGKTQIALEAAYRVHEQDPKCSVFWVPAISMVTFENAYREVGRALGIPGLEDSQTGVKTRVKLALEQSTYEWLLIIDNVDDIALLTHGGLQEYLPFHRNGSIFFTTRNHEVAVQLDVPSKHIHAIGEMNETEALMLLQNNLKPRQYQDCPEATRELVQNLVYLPLAIKQASAYLSKTGETTKAYLEYCLSSDETQVELLNVAFEDRWRYSKNANPITTTWLISFQHLEQTYPLAVDYLKFICFLAETNIPISLLPPGSNKKEEAEAIGILEGYAFISMRDQAQSFDIHRLVRLATRNWTKVEWEMRCTKAMQRLHLIYPWPEHENRQVWMNYLPHAQTILIEHDKCTDQLAIARLAHLVGKSYMDLSKYRESEKMFRHAVELYSSMEDHTLNSLNSMNWLANTFVLQGKLQDAEDIYRELLDTKEVPQSLRISLLNNLASAFQEKGKYQEALEMYQQALMMGLFESGPDDPEVLRTMANIAENFSYQGDHWGAEERFRHLLGRRTEVLGSGHPETLDTLCALGVQLDRLDKLDEAEEMLRDCVQGCILVLGPEHAQTVVSSTCLGDVLRLQDRDDEAEEILRQTLNISKTALGPRSPRTLKTMVSLALVLNCQGQFEEAEALLREAFELRKVVLGEEHPQTLEAEEFLRLITNPQTKADGGSDSEDSDNGGVVL